MFREGLIVGVRASFLAGVLKLAGCNLVEIIPDLPDEVLAPEYKASPIAGKLPPNVRFVQPMPVPPDAVLPVPPVPAKPEREER